MRDVDDKTLLSRERESISRGSSRVPKFGTRYEGVEGEERKESTKSLPLLFLEKFGVSLDADFKKISRAAWFLKRKIILDYLHEIKITYLSALHIELEEVLNYEIPKQTLHRFMKAAVKEGLLQSIPFYPRSKKVNYQVFYATYDCPPSQIEQELEYLRRRDQAELNRGKKQAEEIEEESYKKIIAQKKGILKANQEIPEVKFEDPLKQKVKEKVAVMETELMTEEIQSEFQHLHRCTDSCPRDTSKQCTIKLRQSRRIREKQVKLGKVIARQGTKTITNLLEKHEPQFKQIPKKKYRTCAQCSKIFDSPAQVIQHARNVHFKEEVQT